MTAGTDYEKTIKYTYAYDTEIKVIVNKTEISDVREAKADISKATGKVKGDVYISYSGKEIELTKDNLEIKMSTKPVNKEDYEITGYRLNINKGTAYVDIKGIGNYGGTKSISFKINPKMFVKQ